MQFEIYKASPYSAEIKQLTIKRQWMEDTFDKHAYHCFPVTLSNGLGWGISFPEEISFIWDGISDSTDTHVKVLKGHKYVYTGRSNATISFKTGLILKTKEDLSMMAMPTPNWPIDGVWPFTVLISTSFFAGEFPIAWRITKSNEVITIPANTPVASVMPISLKSLNNSEGIIKKITDLPPNFFPDADYGQIVSEINKKGEWTNFYRDGVDYKGNKIGDHEIKSLRLNVVDGPEQCGIIQ